MDIKVKVIFDVISDMIAFRDDVTGGHLDRTRMYLKLLIDKMTGKGMHCGTMNEWDMDLLLYSASLHDIGKIAISEEILNKPGKLTDEEFETMKAHAALGVEIIDRINLSDKRHLRYARSIAGTHHEKWDGSGYPRGLYGRHIPIEGRLMAIADVYDALISDRPYKRAMPPSKAAAIIEEGCGTHFDPDLVGVFREVAPQFECVASSCAGRHTEAHMVKNTHLANGAVRRSDVGSVAVA